MNLPTLDDSQRQQLDDLLQEAVRRALKQADPQSLIDWMVADGYRAWLPLLGDTLDAGTDPRPAQALARAIWNATPLPDNRYRPRALAKPERNAPCYCGSGRKFKQCCSAFADLDKQLGPLGDLLGQVLAVLPKTQLKGLPIEQIGVERLARAASELLDAGEAERVTLLLEPLFAGAIKLDDRAEMGFDLLMDAYQELGKPKKRAQLLDLAKQSAERVLRAAAWQRQATIDADAGDFAAAWQAFEQATRELPDHPELGRLEVLLLLVEGRKDEAATRGQHWIGHYRRMGGYDDLADMLQGMIDHADEVRAAMGAGPSPYDALAEQLGQLPEPQSHYALTVADGDAGGLQPDAALASLHAQWQRAFYGDDPDARWSPDNYELAFDRADQWVPWLAAHPEAWNSFEVIDDVAQIGFWLVEEDQDWLPDVLMPLYRHGVALLRAVLAANRAEGCRLEWGWLENRAALRAVQNYAWLLVQEAGDGDEAQQLLEWLLNTLNPDDNQGIRYVLCRLYLASGQTEAALALCEAHADEASAELAYGRVLALAQLGRDAEAVQALQAAKQAWPKVWATLTAAKPRKPKLDPTHVTVGGDDEAWFYRERYLPLWRDGGVLARLTA